MAFQKMSYFVLTTDKWLGTHFFTWLTILFSDITHNGSNSNRNSKNNSNNNKQHTSTTRKKLPAGSETPAAEMISVAAWTVFSWKRCTLSFLDGTCRPDMSRASCVAIPVGQWLVPHLSACHISENSGNRNGSVSTANMVRTGARKGNAQGEHKWRVS